MPDQQPPTARSDGSDTATGPSGVHDDEPERSSYETIEPPLLVVGRTGEPGLEGHRGAQGIQGAHGDPGAQGKRGAVGAVGARGTKGTAGPRGVLSARQSLTAFAVIMAIFLLLAYRSEVNADRITDANRRNAVSVHTQCLISARNAASLNALIDTFNDNLATRKDLDALTKERFRAAYARARPAVATCDVAP
jgi:hypothetical protein